MCFFVSSGHSKSVRWLLGRDGDVSVSVIGEVDEFRSSKLLQTLRTNTRLQSTEMNNLVVDLHTVSLLADRENHQTSSQSATLMQLSVSVYFEVCVCVFVMCMHMRHRKRGQEGEKYVISTIQDVA